MAPFSKPETVLKQAEGLVSVGQSHAALQSLTEMFASKRFRSTPLASLEPIMNRFIDLCVEMRKGRTAKEGLMQYKNIAQNTSVQSIEVVVSRFVQLADAKVREAQEKAAVQVAVDVDDLEASETPESILLGAVSGDQSRDRTDRALVTPWLKFSWESYRTSLETLKNNARLEVIYQQIAQQAFKFCLKHQRKVEFRRLCETLRLHLSNVAKYAHQAHSINLQDPDTLQHHLDTRFAQLNTSVELELWQEAFRSVEDVHNLLTMAKKAPRPAMMANYYEKLTKIFLMSGNALYHAAAWSRYYAVVTNIGGKSEEELSRLAGQVLVSALAVPVGLQADDGEDVKGRNGRLTALLGLTKTPTRSRLLKDALSRDILRISSPTIKALYNLLEVTFDPLNLCASITPLLQSLSAQESSYAPYQPLLQRALLSRLLSQLSQVYSSIKIANLLQLVAPLSAAGGAFEPERVEAYLMGCVRRGELNIRVDHRSGAIEFLDDAFAYSADDYVPSTSAGGGGTSSSSSSSSSTTATLSHETEVQSSAAELVRTRLSTLAGCLHRSLVALEHQAQSGSSTSSTLSDQDETQKKQEKFKALVAAAEAERKALQLRRALVARRRELLSELSVRKEKEESSRKAEISRREKEEEGRRAKEDMKRKEIERIKRVNESIKAEEAKKLAQQLIDRGVLKGVTNEVMENLNTDKLMIIQVEQLEKEKKDLNARLRIMAKRIDHVERAIRKEERPLLDKDYEDQQANDRDTFDTVQRAKAEASRREHETNLETKLRLERMLDDYKARRVVLSGKKMEEHAKRKEVATRKMEEEKGRRRQAVMQEREEKRKREEEEERKRREEEAEQARIEAAQRAEEERRAAEEEAVRVAAEAKKREEEERQAQIRKQREEERAEAAERARQMLKREEEAEANRRARAAERQRSTATATAAATVNGESAWRKAAPVPAVRVAAGAGARVESPSPAPVKFKAGGAGSSWRAREEAKSAAAAAGGGASGAAPAPAPAPVRPASPAVGQKEKDDDGFQTVGSSRGSVWRRGGARGRA